MKNAKSKPNNGIRAVLITQGISRIVYPMLQQQHVEIVGIAESVPRGVSVKNKRKMLMWRLIAIVKAMLPPFQSLKNIAVQESISYFLLHKENEALFADWLKMLQADIVIVYSMSQLLSPEIFTIARIGVLNLHPSLLPAYRGPNPWFWMYYNMEKQGGVTLHFVDAGEDTGDIIDQRSYEIPLGIKSPVMQDIAIGKYGVEMILEALEILAQGNPLPRTHQPAKSTTERARNIKPEEHRTFINWQVWSIDRIWHLLSGTELWFNCIEQPGGFYTGQRWEVLGIERNAHQVDPEHLGQVKKDSVGYYVQCQNGIIRLHVRFRFVGLAKGICMRLMR